MNLSEVFEIIGDDFLRFESGAACFYIKKADLEETAENYEFETLIEHGYVALKIPKTTIFDAHDLFGDSSCCYYQSRDGLITLGGVK